MSASIKTVLKLDDTDLKNKLDAISKYVQTTYGQWADETAKLSSKDKVLIDQKDLLAKALARVRDEKAKGAKADKELIAANERLAKTLRNNIKVYQAQKNVILATQKAKAAELTTMKKVETATKQSIATMDKATAARKSSTTAIRQKDIAFKSLANTTIRYLRWAGTIVGVYYAISRAWSVTLGKGLEVNKMMEDNRFGIAAITSANTQMVLSNGDAVTSYEKFVKGQVLATQTMEDLRAASIKTYATFPQLTEIFQQAIGQTQSMGDSFGETVKSITTNTVKLSQRLSNIAGAIGMPMDRVREEIRSMLSGNASTDSLISTMIFGSPTEANESIRAAKERGANGVKDLLDSVLAPFDALENVDSYTRSLLELEDAWSQLWETASKPLFDYLTTGFKDLSEEIRGVTIDLKLLMAEANQDLKGESEYDAKLSLLGAKWLDLQEDIEDSWFDTTKKIYQTRQKEIEGEISLLTGFYQELKGVEAPDLLSKPAFDQKLLAEAAKSLARGKAETLKLTEEIAKAEEQILLHQQAITTNEAAVTLDKATQTILDGKIVASKAAISTFEKLIAKDRAEISKIEAKALTDRNRKEDAYTKQVLSTQAAKDKVLGLEKDKVSVLQQSVITELEILENTKGKEAYLKQEEKLYKEIFRLQKEIAKVGEADELEYAGIFDELDAEYEELAQKQQKVIESTKALNDALFLANAAGYQQQIHEVNEQWTALLEDINDPELLGDAAKIIQAELDAIQYELDHADLSFDLGLDANAWTAGLEGVAKEVANIGNAFQDLAGYTSAYERELDLLNIKELKGIDVTKETAQLKSDYFDANMAGYANLAGAMSNSMEEGSAAAKTFQVIQQGLALTSAITAVLQAASSPGVTVYTMAAYIAAATAMVAPLLGSMGVAFGGGGGGDGFSASNQIARIEADNKPFLDRLDTQIDLLEAIEAGGSVMVAELLKSTTDYGIARQTASAQIAGAAPDNWAGITQSDVDYINSTLGISFLDNIRPELAELGVWASGSSQEVDRNTLSELDPDTLMSLFGQGELGGIHDVQAYQNAISELNDSIVGYATSAISATKDLVKTAESLEDMADELEATDQRYLVRLASAQADVDALIDDSGDTFVEYVDGITTTINEAFEGMDLDELQALLLGTDMSPAAIQERAAASQKLADITQQTFDNGVKDALNYLDSIEMVGEAMILSAVNSKSWTDSFKTDLELVQDQAGSLGVNMAGSMSELHSLFELLSNDAEGLTDAELALLNANKAYLESIEDVTEGITGAVATISELQTSLRSNVDTWLNSLSVDTRNPLAELESMSLYFQSFITDSMDDLVLLGSEWAANGQLTDYQLDFLQTNKLYLEQLEAEAAVKSDLANSANAYIDQISGSSIVADTAYAAALEAFNMAAADVDTEEEVISLLEAISGGTIEMDDGMRDGMSAIVDHIIENTEAANRAADIASASALALASQTQSILGMAARMEGQYTEFQQQTWATEYLQAYREYNPGTTLTSQEILEFWTTRDANFLQSDDMWNWVESQSGWVDAGILELIGNLIMSGSTYNDAINVPSGGYSPVNSTQSYTFDYRDEQKRAEDALGYLQSYKGFSGSTYLIDQELEGLTEERLQVLKDRLDGLTTTSGEYYDQTVDAISELESYLASIGEASADFDLSGLESAASVFDNIANTARGFADTMFANNVSYTGGLYSGQMAEAERLNAIISSGTYTEADVIALQEAVTGASKYGADYFQSVSFQSPYELEYQRSVAANRMLALEATAIAERDPILDVVDELKAFREGAAADSAAVLSIQQQILEVQKELAFYQSIA